MNPLISETIKHEATHIATAKFVGAKVESVEFGTDPDKFCLGSVNVVYSSDEHGAAIAVAPIIFGDVPSDTDLHGLADEAVKQAEDFVIRNANTLRAMADQIIASKLFIFSDGRRGMLLRPLSRNSVFVPA